MFGGIRVGRVAGILLAVGLCAGCGAPASDPTPVPTFALPSLAPNEGGPAEPDRGDGLPTDCAEMFSVADLNALLGLPLDSVAVRTTIGVAEPSVGRTERVACRYSGTAGSPVPGDVLLDLNIARYVDAAAAATQWGRNADVESGERRDLPIGAASAALFERTGEAVLMVVYDRNTLTFVLPDRPLPGDRPRGDALVDLALRVLPAVAPPSGESPTPVDPAVAAGPAS